MCSVRNSKSESRCTILGRMCAAAGLHFSISFGPSSPVDKFCPFVKSDVSNKEKKPLRSSSQDSGERFEGLHTKNVPEAKVFCYNSTDNDIRQSLDMRQKGEELKRSFQDTPANLMKADLKCGKIHCGFEIWQSLVCQFFFFFLH